MQTKFDIDIEMTATIGVNTATNIIVAAVERQTGQQISDISVKYDGDKFAGFNLTFDSKIKPKTNFVPTKGFIPMNFDEN